MRMIFICCMCKVDMPDIAEKQKYCVTRAVTNISNKAENKGSVISVG